MKALWWTPGPPWAAVHKLEKRSPQWRCGYRRSVGTTTSRPVIIEDNVFVGSRCIVVEGVRVEKEAVLGANVVLTASTKIIDVTG